MLLPLTDLALDALMDLMDAPELLDDAGPEGRDAIKQEVGNTIARHLAQHKEP